MRKFGLKHRKKLNNNKQISRANAGKYSFLTGLMKCAKCGYAIKVNNFKKDGKLKLVCSGKSNLSACDADIAVNLRELEKLHIGRN
ncbi:MAG: zinc ribbon domain-containing protein [Clostridiales bacterium]|nr:MAG: zinc ribbon domain-containing protein [Clostridiales bacterium]